MNVLYVVMLVFVRKMDDQWTVRFIEARMFNRQNLGLNIGGKKPSSMGLRPKGAQKPSSVGAPAPRGLTHLVI